jgi:hypothetical protein
MNPASRLNTIVQFFNSANPSESMLSAWQRYLGLELSGSEEEALIATQAVLGEIKGAQAKLRQIKAPEELFDEAANSLKNAFSPTQLAGGWSNHRDSITKRAVPLALQWASWALSRFDENDIPEESIKSLEESLAAQETMLKEVDLPESLREMLERQVADLKTALVLYKISGVKPLIDVVNKQSSEMRHAPAEMVSEVENGSSETKGVVQSALRLIGQAAKVADQGSKIFQFGKDMHALGSGAWQSGQQLIGSFQAMS